MRGRVPVLACLLLSCSPSKDAAPVAGTSPSSRASAPPEAPPSAAVAPGQPPWQPLADLARPPDAPKTRADEALLTNLLGADRVRSCHGVPGEVLPALGAGYAGAFTRPGVRETAYLVTFVPCVGRVTPGVPAARPPAILVIAREHRPVLKAEVPGGRFIVPRDPDGDGVDEILVVGGVGGGMTARVVGVRGGAIATLVDLGTVAAPCAVVESRVTAKGLQARARATGCADRWVTYRRSSSPCRRGARRSRSRCTRRASTPASRPPPSPSGAR